MLETTTCSASQDIKLTLCSRKHVFPNLTNYFPTIAALKAGQAIPTLPIFTWFLIFFELQSSIFEHCAGWGLVGAGGMWQYCFLGVTARKY